MGCIILPLAIFVGVLTDGWGLPFLMITAIYILSNIEVEFN